MYGRSEHRCATGAGLVPVYQLAMLVVSDKCDETKITLLYCCTSYEQVLLRRELCELQGYWNVHKCGDTTNWFVTRR